MLRGFDASAVQGELPFDQLKGKYSFGIFKCYQGNDGPDPNFEKNVRVAEAAGITPFAYCFAYPLPNKPGRPGRDPQEQARLFVDHAWKVLPNRRILIDLEWPPPQDWGKWDDTAQSVSNWSRDCCAEVTRLCNWSKPIIYTYPDWWGHVSTADVSWAADYELWMASYNVKGWPQEGQNPVVPAPWTDWLFWQFDGNGGLRLPNGVDADFCVFKGDEGELAGVAT